MTTLRFRSIRAQLTAITLAAFAVMAVILALVSVVVSREAMLASIDADLQRRGEGFIRDVPQHDQRTAPGFDPGAQPTAPPPDDYGFEAPPERPPDAPGQDAPTRRTNAGSDPLWIAPTSIPVTPDGPAARYSSIYDPVGFAKAAKGESGFRTLSVDGEERRVFSIPRRFQGRIVAVAQVAYQLDPVHEQLATMRWRLLATMLPLGLLVGGAASFGVVNRMMKPLRRLNEDAVRIGQNGFGERLPPLGQDEFATLSETLNTMLTSLEGTYRLEREANERQRRFTADASHEIKTPLAVIKAHLGILKRSKRSLADEHETLLAMERATERMTRLLQSLLVLAKSDDGTVSERIPCALEPIIDDIAQSLPEARGRVTISPFPSIQVWANPDDLHRLFGNLIENALKHSQATEPVEITARPEATHLVIEVRDHGIGIAPEHLPHLFERFYRVDRSRAAASGGTGLGLAICEQIVKAHGGTLQVSSEVGSGTVFVVSLPIDDPKN